jgi:hypothetical protein
VKEDDVDRALALQLLAAALGRDDVLVTAGFEPHRQREMVVVAVIDN